MKLIAAIDISKGKVVRLRQGKKGDFKVYGSSPLEFARRWQREGADALHIIDLDAAWGGGTNLGVIEKITKEISLDVEVGGGLRSLSKIEEVLRAGARRAIIGTRALDEDFLKQAVKKFGEKVAVSIDAVGMNVAIEGWQERTPVNVLEMAEIVKRLGVKWVIYTDISRDGTLGGPNIETMKKIISCRGPHYILSGGLSSLADIRKINKELDSIFGVILGKALYEGKIKLPEAKKALEKDVS